MKWRWWRTAAEMADDFTESRNPISDVVFLASCDLPNSELARQTALAVRRSVAAYGLVDSDFIAASDRYPDELIDLSGWDSLDFMAWVFELENQLDESISPDAYAKLRVPFTVKDLVNTIYHYRLDRGAAHRIATEPDDARESPS